MVFAELLCYADECFPSNLGEFLALISSGVLSAPFLDESQLSQQASVS